MDPIDVRKFRHLRHGNVSRQGKPRLQNVKADSLEIVIALTPVPSFIWNQCLLETAAGTVLEGRITLTGSAATLASMDDELENDVRRFDQLVKDTNTAVAHLFDAAQAPAEKPLTAELTEAQRRKALEERLRRF